MHDHFDDIWGEVNRGMEGKNNDIPIGFYKLSRYVGIRKRIYTLVFAATGSGKSSIFDEAFILNPFDHYIQHKKQGIKAKPILFSQERSKVYRKTKWLIRKVFIDHGRIIPIHRALGWFGEKLTMDEKNLLEMYRDYMNELCEFVDIIEGAQWPTFIYDYLKRYMLAQGKMEEVTEHKNIYIPNNEDEVVIPIIDTIGLTRLQKGIATKKDAVDKVSESLQYFRDVAAYSPVVVAQMNRDKSNPIYLKQDIIEPTIDDVKESGRPAEDADLILSLFQPSRYNTRDASYDVKQFLNPETGIDYFRRVKILKSSYGEADVGVGMGFMGVTGMFKEMPHKSQMDRFDYESLFNHSFFLENKTF